MRTKNLSILNIEAAIHRNKWRCKQNELTLSTCTYSTSRAEWDGYSDGLPLSPRYESRLEGVSFT